MATIKDRYAAVCGDLERVQQEMAALLSYEQRLLGEADLCRALLDAGHGALDVTPPDDAEPDPDDPDDPAPEKDDSPPEKE